MVFALTCCMVPETNITGFADDDNVYVSLLREVTHSLFLYLT